MNKVLNIIDFRNRKKKITINNFENVLIIKIDVVTGDEILTVVYKNGKKIKFDSSSDRMLDFFDYTYYILDKSNDFDIIKKWVERETSYDFENEGLI